MFGNTKGWILAAIVLVIELGIVGWLISLDDVTEPTQLSSVLNLEPISFSTSPRTIVPNGPKGDAGATYRKLIAAYESNGEAYRKFESKGTLADDRIIEDIRLLSEAADEKFTNLFANTPDEIVAYEFKEGPLQALRVIARAATNYATIALKDGKYEVAREYYEAVFALGAAMFEERLTYAQAGFGFELMATASNGMLSVAKKENDSKRVNRMNDFQQALNESVKLWRDIDNKLLTAQPDPLTKHIGDRIKFLNESKERMWRVESALGLGLVRSDVGLGANIRPADIVAAEHALKEVAEKDPDPVVKLAAQRAKNLDKAEAMLAIRAVTMK